MVIGFILIHSPLVGPYTWSKVAGALAGRGYAVATPSLMGCDAPFWQNHLARIAAAAPSLPAGELAIIAHSGAGPLLPLVANALGSRVSVCIYVDAMLPTGGDSRIEHVPPEFAGELRRSAVGGLMPAWGASWPVGVWEALLPDAATRVAFRAELMPTRLAVYTEPVPEPAIGAASAYVQFSEGYDAEAAAASARGWTSRRLEGGHLHMLVRPDEVADALIAVSR